MAKLATAVDLKSITERFTGSSPVLGTKLETKLEMVIYLSSMTIRKLLHTYVQLLRETSRSVKDRAYNISSPEISYPKIVAKSKSVGPNSMGDWKRIRSSKNPILELEKLAVWETNPSLHWDHIGKLLPKLRKNVGDILQAYENDELYDALEAMNLFGRKADAYRYEADREY